MDWLARGIATASALIAVASLGWAVLSWRLTGPALRINSLAYRQVLLLKVFNAGRTAETIEHVVLGGRKGGAGGLDLTRHLDLPLRLEPGEAKSWRLRPQASPLAERWSIVSAGWESVWVLTGSMRQHRAEVIPFPDQLPPEVGWRLIPKRAAWARYSPLVLGVPTAVVASAGARWFAVWLVCLGIIVVIRGMHALGGNRVFHRRRVERWALAVGWVLGLLEWTRGLNRSAGDELPKADTGALVLYLLVALVLAIPGLATRVALGWKNAGVKAKAIADRLRSWFPISA